jgi:hypothetical protein
VTTTGFPTAALSESGALPSGVTFTDNGDGTATLAGTPAAGTAGSYSFTITADNGVSPAATQNFTLKVARSEPWPASVSGVPRPAAHSAEGYYLGVSGNVWSLRVTHPDSSKVTFSGTITVTTGELTNLTPIGLGSQDTVTLKPKILKFTLQNYGGVIGFRFTSNANVTAITFTLDINGVPVRGRYLVVDRPRRLLLSWGHAGSDRLPPGASTVEVILTPRDFLDRLVIAAAGGDPGPDPWADGPPATPPAMGSSKYASARRPPARSARGRSHGTRR